jgi:hypothetical protein
MLEFKLKGIDKAFLTLPIVKDVDVETIRSFIARSAVLKVIEEKHFLIQEGQKLDQIYVIADNPLGVGMDLYQLPRGEDGKPYQGDKIKLNNDGLITAGPFGENSVFTGNEAVCDVIAVGGPVKVFSIKKKDLLKFAHDNPSVQARIMQKIADDTRHNKDLQVLQSQMSVLQNQIDDFYEYESDEGLLLSQDTDEENP